MIVIEQPPNFDSRFDVSCTFVEWDEKILLLHRQDHKSYGNKWGAPAGKVNENEGIKTAALRELEEETGIKVSKKMIKYLNTLYVKYPDFDFIFHMFFLRMVKQPMVTLDPNTHKAYSWVNPIEALSMELVPDEDFCIKKIYKI